MGPSWDATSGYGAVEASRAVSPDDLSEDLAAALASGGLSESAHLATVPLPGEASRVIARTWDETSGYGSVEASRADR